MWEECLKEKEIQLLQMNIPEFIDLSQGQIKAIQLIKKVPAERVEQALKGAGVSSEDINFAREFIKKH